MRGAPIPSGKMMRAVSWLRCAGVKVKLLYASRLHAFRVVLPVALTMPNAVKWSG